MSISNMGARDFNGSDCLARTIRGRICAAASHQRRDADALEARYARIWDLSRNTRQWEWLPEGWLAHKKQGGS